MQFSLILYQNMRKHLSIFKCNTDIWLLICSVNSYILLIVVSRYGKEKMQDCKERKACQMEWTGTLQSSISGMPTIPLVWFKSQRTNNIINIAA